MIIFITYFFYIFVNSASINSSFILKYYVKLFGVMNPFLFESYANVTLRFSSVIIDFLSISAKIYSDISISPFESWSTARNISLTI